MHLAEYSEDLEIALKILIVGNGAVGKSSLIQRYCRGVFTNQYKKTMGVDFLEKSLSISGEEVRLLLWDTAGQEEFDCITRVYYRGAQGCILVFSTTDRSSFKQVLGWKRKVEEECGRIPMLLVQNKMDLLHESTVDSDEVEEMSRKLGLKLIKTSVKENLNTAQVFSCLSQLCLNERTEELKREQFYTRIGGSLGLERKSWRDRKHNSAGIRDLLVRRKEALQCIRLRNETLYHPTRTLQITSSQSNSGTKWRKSRKWREVSEPGSHFLQHCNIL
ncbi:ras-related protein Rab-23 [Eurytemora carolleeae]|uniref:ras-related protein Rab-23 n=1 Tax=Eurytemora carolleeae TaxID=1294199 RepID=UPI000C7923AE|nr:ras-related protein Rab-23 [Eurytemora carolleeae]|eukprot:XP_023321324.1 ras-related protein Rab-23-like [Eurytemora affinis]